jgi:hypothetical protein
MHLDQGGLDQQEPREQRGCKGQLVLLEAQAQAVQLAQRVYLAQLAQRELLVVKAALVQREPLERRGCKAQLEQLV